MLCGRGDDAVRICKDCLADWVLEHREGIEKTAARCGCNPMDLIRWRRRQ
jgi:hypothetical protein